MMRSLYPRVSLIAIAAIALGLFSCAGAGVTTQFSVSYEANGAGGGSAPLDSKTYPASATVMVLGNSGGLYKTGYMFGGWDTRPDGTGIRRAAGSSFAMGSGDVVLYAAWDSYNYVITFDSQGATAAASPASMTVASPNTKLASLPSEPAKAGYYFAGWWSAVDGGGSEFTVNTTVTGNLIVYAKWAKAFGASVSIPGDGDVTMDLSRSATDPARDAVITVSVRETFESYAWYLDGKLLEGSTGKTIHIEGKDLSVGTHGLMCAVADAKGNVSSASITFKVSN